MACYYVIDDFLIHPTRGNHQKGIMYAPNIRYCDGSALIVSYYLPSALERLFFHLVIFLFISISVSDMVVLSAMIVIVLIGVDVALSDGYIKTKWSQLLNHWKTTTLSP